MSPQERLPKIVLRILIAGFCLFGIWSSWKLARADYLFRQDTPVSIRSAILLAPDASAYYMRLAQLDEGNARNLLETALRLNQYNAQADIELGLRYEADGDPAKAEKLLLHAFSIDHTYVPRWSLANFYLRQGNMSGFWTWARGAAEMPSDDIGGLFQLCWRVSPDPVVIAQNILNNNPQVLRQYLVFLVGKDQPQAVAGIASRLLSNSSPATDRPLLFSVVNWLVAGGDSTAASAVWNQMVQQKWAFADKTMPNNASFTREPQPVSFDWSLPSYPGLHSWPGPNGLETEFTGEEPESCTIAEQALVLTPGNYTMEYSYRTTDIPPDTGIHWQILDAKSGAVLAESPTLSSRALQQETLSFSVGPQSSLLRLRLAYQRTLGTVRISGTLVIPSTRIITRPQA